jgi:ribulose-phosphate 3-epimerase
MNTPIIAASILSADFARLADDCRKAVMAGVGAIHFDVMDHHYVPNLSFGAVVCEALVKASVAAPIDVHLMVENPGQYIESFAKAGAQLITIHPSTTPDVGASLEKIRTAGMKAGLAFNPDESVDLDDDVLASLDMVLLMSVFPGFGGQGFIPDVMDKIAALRIRLDALGAHAYLGVDGGVKVDNARAIIAAGADFLVMGSGLFKADDYSAVVTKVLC